MYARRSKGAEPAFTLKAFYRYARWSIATDFPNPRRPPRHESDSGPGFMRLNLHCTASVHQYI